MCGIAGFLSFNADQDLDGLLKKMGEKIAYRGPDDYGIWCDASAGIGLSHRRLSILDLSASGHQPMFSASGRFVMVYNGEIYNHQELRRQFENGEVVKCWKGHSDTETILELFDFQGIEKTISSLIGMFAIAVWDRASNTLTLTRDRIGEKPLYYGWQGKSFLFASELKAISIHPDFNNQIDKISLSQYFKYNYVPAPRSIYVGINKLMPGTIHTVSLSNTNGITKIYWNFKDVIANQSKISASLDEKDLVCQLDVLLKKAVERQMMSDVPLGAFLSGGVDSSTIVGIMQSVSSTPIKTFTIGFDEKNFNEAVYAKEVSLYLGTHHTEMYVSPKDSLDVIPLLPKIYDEPFSDSSQIPTFLVAKLAKSEVTVSLSGDAGDELFGGYNRYLYAQNTWNVLSKMPIGLRTGMGSLIRRISASQWDSIYKVIQPVLPNAFRLHNPGDKIHKSSHVLNAKSLNYVYNNLVNQIIDKSKFVLNDQDSHMMDLEIFNSLSGIEQMMATDTLTYLPDDILVKVDRAAMYNSLETRVPFLDVDVIEFAWSLPLSIKIKEGKGKWILRQVLEKYVPTRLIDRPKMGFGVPIQDWLRGPLRYWAEELLDKKKIEEQGLLDYTVIRTKWEQHLNGSRNWQYQLWSVLMFQAWLNEQRNG